MPPATLSVYFDGSCPLCLREIAFYRRCAGAQSIAWIDASQIAADEVAPGLSKQAALARFHVVTADGDIASGAEAFRRVWLLLPRFRWLGLACRARPVSWLLERAYTRFLVIRPAIQRLAGRRPLSRQR